MNVYEQAIEQTRREVERRTTETARLRDRAATVPQGASLIEAISGDSLALIAEPKRALHSTSANPSDDMAALVRDCAEAGVAAISIVTEKLLSDGSIDDLVAARAATTLPLLARNFVIDPLQVYEARIAGADAVLVPVMAFDPDEEEQRTALADVIEAANALGMEVALSVQNETELQHAVEHDADIVHIDNRQADGDIDVERTLELLNEVPAGKMVISESVANADEVAHLHRAGVDALLLDEGHLEGDLRTAIATFASLSLDA